VSSAPAAAESGAARKRGAGADGGEASEPFALPDEAGTQASSAAKSSAAAEAKPNAGKAEAPTKAAPATPVAKAPTNVVAPDAEPVATAQEAAANTASSQTGASALLAAAIAAQAEAPVTKGADKGGETSATKDGDETAASTVDPSALLLVAALLPEAAKPVATGPSVDASASAAVALAGALPAGAGVSPAAGTGAQAVATETAAEAVNPIAAAIGKPIAQKAAPTHPLQGSDADKPKGEDAGKADPATGAGHLAAAHLARGEGSESVLPVAAQDAVQPAEFKVSDLLQPLQGVIDLSAPARSARPDAALAMTPEQAAAQAATAQAQAATGQPTPLHVVPIEIGLRALAGGRKFDIRLDPAELGRVDVSLDISDKGEVTAKLVVDRVETLHLLQRDARTLERAFEQAGLKPSNAGVDIILRDPGDQSGFRQNRQQDDAPRRTPGVTDSGEDIGIAAQPVQSTSVRGLIRLGGVDLSI
jgi:hypothetical protein